VDCYSGLSLFKFEIKSTKEFLLFFVFQDPDAPFPYVFEQVGWPAIKWIVTVGAIFALCTW